MTEQETIKPVYSFRHGRLSTAVFLHKVNEEYLPCVVLQKSWKPAGKDWQRQTINLFTERQIDLAIQSLEDAKKVFQPEKVL